MSDLVKPTLRLSGDSRHAIHTMQEPCRPSNDTCNFFQDFQVHLLRLFMVYDQSTKSYIQLQ